MKIVYFGVFIAAFVLGMFLNFSVPFESVTEQSSEVKSKVLGSCHCQIGKSPENTIEFEDPEACPKDRLYFQTALKKISPVYLLPRAEKEKREFPVSCVGYIMKKYIDASEKPSRYYSFCASTAGQPVRPKKSHCMTEEYVNSVYNSYVDIMDCLDIPQRDLLPKLFNESGLHINTLGAGMDAGVGQLTAPAISSVQQKAVFDGKTMAWIDMFKDEVFKSAKPSCLRISKIPKLFDRISEAPNQRCDIIAAPENPLKNVLYTGIFYHYILHSQTGSRYFKGYTYFPVGTDLVRFDHRDKDVDLLGYFNDYKVKARIKELGIEKPNMQALKQMMITLGYNSGMESAFIFLDHYLKSRKAAKLKLKDIDFDFQTQFISKLGKKLTDTEAEKQRQKDLNSAKTAPFRLPFPMYLKLVQKSGTPGYLSLVASKLLLLDKEMGEGTCTTPGFLKF